MDPPPPPTATVIVCCLCGDVGFPDRLFRCSSCRRRFQHSYCSSYGGEGGAGRRCDWCRSEESSSSSCALSTFRNGNEYDAAMESSNGARLQIRSPYTVDHIKQSDRGGTTAEKTAGKSASRRATTRRYKLLKDVM